MRLSARWAGAAVLVWTSGCGLREPKAVVSLGEVGPGAPAPAASGRLVVRTERFESKPDDVSYWLHSPYELYDAQGSLVRRVRNHRSDRDESPEVVELPPGKYRVRAEEPKRIIEVTVAVESGRVTEVDVPRLASGR